jgi:hypothetical protein
MTNITPELKTFMNELWDSTAGTTKIVTPIGTGIITEMRTTAGIDIEVAVKIPEIDGLTLFSGIELFEMDRV